MDVSTLREEAADQLDDAVALRRRLHRWPEIGNDLPITREQVLEALDGLPLQITAHTTTSGLAAVLDGGKPGPTVLLRGDMDALPMPEDTGEEFSSRVDGAMHACGHDTHTAMLVGAAKILSARRADIPGRVLFMFQPGEEGHDGAEHMLNEGLLELPARPSGEESPITGAYALHITSMLPTGVVATRRGPLMASADSVLITVTGRGGHASAPHMALDPIPIACEIVQSLQLMVTRRINVFDPGVITVGRITAGTTNNVIPETAEIEATLRAVSEATRNQLHDGIRRVAEGIAAAHGAEVHVDMRPGYPVTVNDVTGGGFALDTGRELLGADKVVEMPFPVMGAEDFSYVLQRLPGAMCFLGATHPDRDLAAAAPNHSNRVVFDEDAMVDGMAMHSALALRHLSPSET